MKAFYTLILAAVLSACGGQQNTATPEQPKQVANICPASMGITAEKLLLNMDSGLKATNAPTAVSDKNVVQNECGYQVTIKTAFGAVLMQLNPQQEVLNIGAVYEKNGNLADNTQNMFAVIQTVISTNGTAKLGETEVGKVLFETTAGTIQAAKSSGTASKDIEYGGNLYTVSVEGNAVAILARKKF